MGKAKKLKKINRKNKENIVKARKIVEQNIKLLKKLREEIK